VLLISSNTHPQQICTLVGFYTVQIGSLLPIFQDNFHTTKLFKKQNIGVAYKTNNNIGRILNRNKKQII